MDTIVHQFVNREAELKFITSKLTALQSQRQNFDFILTISGVAGIGKTSLLEEVDRLAARENIPAVWLRFNSAEAKKDDVLYLLRQLTKSLPDSDLQEIWHEYASSPFPFVQDRLTQALVDKMIDRPMVWLFDDSHLMAAEVKEILEDMLMQLPSNHQLLLIMAGRDIPSWNNFELRRRTRPFPLSSLPKESAALLAPGTLYAPVTDQVYDLTRGYPKASVMAYDWIKKNLSLNRPDLAQQLKSHEAELIFALFDDLFEEYILGDIPDRDRTSQLLRCISPLRHFDDYLLSNLLPELGEALFGKVSILEARALMRQIAIQTRLIKWDSGRRAYILEPPIRRLLYLDLQYRDKAKLQRAHQFMQEWYQNALDETLEKDASSPQSVIYLLEYLYHYIHNQQLAGQTSVAIHQVVRQKIDQQFTYYQLRERNHFLEELNRDTDILELLANDSQSLIEYVVRLVERGT